MELKLKDKHILVTGGTGGIGRAIVELLVLEGAKVSIHFHKNTAKAQELQNKHISGKVVLLKGDLKIESEVKDVFSKATNHFGRIDGLVANAGIWAPTSKLTTELDLEQWKNTLDVNLTGVFLCVKEFFKNLIQYPDSNASLVLIGSTAGLFGEAGYSDYSATKAALQYGLTNTWKNEIVNFASLGRVNTVAPGWVLTEMAEKSLEDKEALKKILQTIPLKKIAKPEDVARTVVYLLSDHAAGHISGNTLLVHGGMEGRVLFDKDDISI
ncbi:MAG: SDR family oxidoreductase [Candidatus Heimdallarchaeota archaeon]|nr:SDR family oxidoreductase [Candidatus Heimdallarchaeota archaeon]